MSTIKGFIKRINPPVTKGEYTSQSIVVTIDSDTQYPQDIQFDLSKKMMEVADSWTEGSEVEIDYNLRGRDYTNKQGELANFTGIQAWRVRVQSAGARVHHNDHGPSQPEFTGGPNSDPDLPF